MELRTYEGVAGKVVRGMESFTATDGDLFLVIHFSDHTDFVFATNGTHVKSAELLKVRGSNESVLKSYTR